MKKYFLLALVVLTGIASSCKYDDDDLWENVNDLADRVTSLEAATKQMNSDIAAMQSIISALQNQVTVSKVEELKDGYIIHFSDGTKATIKNGADGKDGANGADGKDGVDGENGKDGKDGANAPIINVKQEGGVYYWTITVDGKTEWLTDEDGNKLRVSGEDGEDGKDGTSGSSGKNGNTPLLKVNAAGNWTVSYDNGATYTEVKDVNNQPVKAKGENGVNGDSKFTRINQFGDMLIIVFDGKTYEIPLAASVTYTGNAIVGDVVTLAPKTSVTLNYKLPEMLNASVEVVKAPNFVAVEAGNGKLTIKAKSTATEPGKIVLLYYNANKTITSVLTVKVTTTVATAADLQTQLNAGGTVTLTSDIEKAQTVNVKGATLDGNGKAISFENTPSTSNYGLSVKSGTIKNIEVSGESLDYNGKTYGFRAVYITAMEGNVYIDHSTLTATYPINVNGSYENYGLYVSNTTLLGWTSYGAIKEAKFTDCYFGKNNNLANLRPYTHTTLTNCDFEEGFTITRDKVNTKEFTISLTNCFVGEVKVTAANFETLLAGASGEYSLQTDTNITVVVDGTTVAWSANN